MPETSHRESDSCPLLCFGPNKFTTSPGVTQIDRDCNRWPLKLVKWVCLHFNYHSRSCSTSQRVKIIQKSLIFIKLKIFSILAFLTKDVSKIHTGSEGGFRGWGQSDTSWVYQWYKVSKNVFGKAVLSLVAEFQK